MPDRMFGAFFGRQRSRRATAPPMRYANTNLHSRAAITPVSADKSSKRIWIMVMLLKTAMEPWLRDLWLRAG